MTRKQQQISELQQQISKLEARIQQLEEHPEFDEEEPLLNFSDFPKYRGSFIYVAISRALQKYGADITVGDLIGLTPKKLLRQANFGLKSLEVLESWMSAHGLQFIEK